MEVEENCAVPIALLTLNVTDAYRGFGLRYSLVPGKRSARGLALPPAAASASQRRAAAASASGAAPGGAPPSLFRVDPRNGTLVLTESPDRELRPRYEVTVRVDINKKGRALGHAAHLVYPVGEERLSDLGKELVAACL